MYQSLHYSRYDCLKPPAWGGGGGEGGFDKKLQEPLLHPILSWSTGDDLIVLFIG